MTEPQSFMTAPPTPEEIAQARVNSLFLDNGQGKPKTFSSARLGQRLIGEYPAARDMGGHLYAYHDGRWQSGGERYYRGQVRDVLGERWKSAQSSEVLTWIEDGAVTLDENPPKHLIRVLNGIVDVEDDAPVLGEASVYPLSPVYLPVAYDPTAECPLFRKFIREALPGELGLIAQEIAGYLLTPDNSQQKAFLFQGTGGNGKSTWISVITALLGEENTQAYALQQLAPDYRFNVANLYGKLANLAADISADELSSSSTFKTITGGSDRLNGEHKGKQGFKFLPFCRLVFSANRFPAIANPDAALFERWIVLPFEQKFRDAAGEVKGLDRMIIEQELPGVLNWALEGLVRLRRQGSFTRSESGDRAAAAFRLKADTISQFLQDEDLGFKVGTFYKRGEMYIVYKDWATDHGQKSPLNKTAFFERMRDVLGAETKRGDWGWVMK